MTETIPFGMTETQFTEMMKRADAVVERCCKEPLDKIEGVVETQMKPVLEELRKEGWPLPEATPLCFVVEGMARVFFVWHGEPRAASGLANDCDRFLGSMSLNQGSKFLDLYYCEKSHAIIAEQGPGEDRAGAPVSLVEAMCHVMRLSYANFAQNAPMFCGMRLAQRKIGN